MEVFVLEELNNTESSIPTRAHIYSRLLEKSKQNDSTTETHL